MSRYAWLIAAVGCAANEPRVTAEKMPVGFQTLVLGASTEEAVVKLFPRAKRTADKSLGGDQIVQRNDHPAIVLAGQTQRAQRRKLERMGIPEASIVDDLARVPATLPDDSPWESIEIDLVPPKEGAPPVLTSISVSRLKATGGEGTCDWLRKTFGKDPELTKCAGTNRVFKDQGSFIEWCAGTADAKASLVVECGSSTVDGVTSDWLRYYVW